MVEKERKGNVSERRKGHERRTEGRRFVHEREEKRNGNVQERGREGNK